MTAMEILITAAAILVMFSLIFSTDKHEPAAEQYPIKYPVEPAPEVFAEILDFMDNCTTRNELKSLYVKIIIFSSCYPDEKEFEKDLWSFYREKESAIV